MLADFRIEGYRCFRDLKLENLRRINLIAGKNSVGKSSVLEALHLYQGASLAQVQDVLTWRDNIGESERQWTQLLVAPLFRGGDKEDRFSSISLRGDRTVHIGKAVRRLLPDGTWYVVDRRYGANELFESPETPILRIGDPNAAAPLLIVPLDGSYSSPPVREVFEADRPNAFLRSTPMDTEGVCAQFERVVATDLEELVVKLLLWVVPDLERLYTRSMGGNRQLLVRRRGSSAHEPLKQLGEGAVRLCSIALALATSRDGLCLIDEIENGIHHELFDQLWEAISRFAEELNVQVFATTHSKDCIEAFERSYRDPKFDAAFYRLERNGDDIGAVRLDHESFFAVVEGTPHEVR